ncbi:MAG: primase [Thermoleophilaceae bacterium]|nr:primase [Thermoleophilaceae bacterium]
MGLYTQESIDKVKDAVDMVELVGARSDLRRVGSRWTGLCPFHDERTPSFSVNAENKLYYCFGCGESGDAIQFVEATEGLDFKETIELLAERYGIELKRDQEDPEAEQRRRRRERLLALVERATGYYERVLWTSPEAAKARSYLAERGLGEEVLRTFRVGYAPSAWDKLMMAAQREGYSHEELAASGLGQKGRQGGFYDRFRARIMFPLADPRGKVLGFGARAMRDDQGPKYVNTSENELYHKGRQLFGIDHARGPAARAGRVVAVEGYTDVLALHQAGVTETVAIMGTALTQEQMAELGRAAGTVYLALDADRAGQDAMLRAARTAKERKLELLVVDMPEGSDPADLIASRGKDAFLERVAGARQVPDFHARRIAAQADLDSVRGRDEAIEQVVPLVAQLADKPATREELVRYLHDRLDVPREYLLAQSPAPIRRPDPGTEAPSPGRTLRLDATARVERSFLTMCVSSAELGHEYVERLDEDHFSSGALRRVRDHLARHWDNPLAALPDDDPMLSALIKDVVMRADDTHVSEDVLRLDFLQLELRRVDRRLRHAEQESDFEAQRALAPERQGLKAQIDELMGATA